VDVGSSSAVDPGVDFVANPSTPFVVVASPKKSII
jgi:hypothetical protein